jgi:hypothetical protein
LFEFIFVGDGGFVRFEAADDGLGKIEELRMICGFAE